jgi:hypothetical protein
MAKLLVITLLCCLIATPCLSWDKKSQRLGPEPGDDALLEGPVVGVTAIIEPCILVHMRTEPAGPGAAVARGAAPTNWSLQASGETGEEYIRFYATGGPDLYAGDSQVVVLVSTNEDTWAIGVQATPLQGEGGDIEADRVFAQSEYTDPDADEGGGVGYICIGTPRVIAAGPQSEISEFHVNFRLKTTHMDKAGKYAGRIFLDYLISP